MTTKTQRRSAPRWPGSWAGRFRLEDTALWQQFRMVDVSKTGIAIEPLGLAAGEEPDGWILIELLGPEEEPLRLRGEIRHRTRTADGGLRLGIEFLGLSQLEAKLIGLLFRHTDSRP